MASNNAEDMMGLAGCVLILLYLAFWATLASGLIYLVWQGALWLSRH